MKLDPDKELSTDSIEKIAASGTDALMISGTQNVTVDKVRILLSRIKRCTLPKVLEPSHPDQIIPGFDYIFVPYVINSTSTDWLVGKHVEWIKNYRIAWHKVVPETYIVLNSDSAVARVTHAKTDLSESEIIAYARCTERYFKFPIVYIEYSGSYGSVNIVKAVSKVLTTSALFYGGGITTKAKASGMARYADTIVVGNVIYENLDNALSTVLSTKQSKKKKSFSDSEVR